MANTIAAIHSGSRQTYGVRRIHAELRLGHGVAISHKRVWRCMKLVGLQGVHRRRWRLHRPAEASWPDLVNRQFHAEGPDRLWVTDITPHRTAEGWVYAAVVLDVFSRRVVGWSIADHLRTELVADALDMARLRRKPVGTVVHSDRGTQPGFNRSSQHQLDAVILGVRRVPLRVFASRVSCGVGIEGVSDRRQLFGVPA